MPGKWELIEDQSGRPLLCSERLEVGWYALGLLLLVASSSCGAPERYGPPPGQGGGDSATCVGAECFSPPTDCAEPAPGCPCAVAGEHLVCGHVESQVASQTVCGKGYSVCSDGVWAPCVINNTAPLVRPAPSPPGASHPLSHGKPTKCVGNPCDPSCWDFIDTPIGEDKNNTGIFVDAAGITLVAGGPPPALYAAADFVRDYDAVGLCAPGSTPLWGLWSWKAPTPAGTSITFSVQTAASAAELSKAPVDALLFSDPPGPSSLAGKPASARLGPPDTTAGSAVVDTTLVSQGRIRGLPFLRITAHLAPSSDGKSAPVLAAWHLQMSCAASE
jgi:hypothetical protein